MTAAALIFLLLLCPGKARAAAAAVSRNPDRWVTLDSSVSGTQSKSSGVYSATRVASSTAPFVAMAVSVTELVLVPLNDQLTANASVGANLSGNSTNNGNSTNSGSVLTYQVGLRRYFLDHDLVDASPTENPDRWPSFNLTAGGNVTIDYAADNTVGNDRRSLNTWGYNGSVDARLPLSDAFTLIPLMAVSYGDSNLSQTQATSGSRTVTRLISPSLTVRYYLVGNNLISIDSSENPDRWTMFDLTVGGTASLAIDQSYELAGKSSSRDNRTGDVDVSLGARIPVTDHASWTVAFDYAYDDSSAPLIPAGKNTVQVDQSTTRNPEFKFSTGLRYFFF